MTVVELHRYQVAMADVAAQARRCTHLIVARHKRTGETQSWHARPRRDAAVYAEQLRKTLSAEWAVRVVPVRRGWWR